MSKSLPKPQKTLRAFILENDAKITDKTAAKISITTAFLAINLMAASYDANAKGHSNHNSHQNKLNVETTDYITPYHVGNNFNEEEYPGTNIAEKTVQSAHGNHYNHGDGGGQGGLLGAIDVFGIGDKDPGAGPTIGSNSVMPESEIRKLEETEERN